MKKTLLFIALAATSIGFSSCNKTYTCRCVLQTVDTADGEVLQSGETSAPIEARNEGDAKTVCESSNSSITNGPFRQTVSCSLQP